jgi:hypothetical protein
MARSGIFRARRYGSRRRQIRNGYGPADWFPGDHPSMPPIVAQGRMEAMFQDVFAARWRYGDVTGEEISEEA